MYLPSSMIMSQPNIAESFKWIKYDFFWVEFGWFEVTHYFFMTDFKKIPAWWRIKFTERFLSVQVSMKMVEKLGRRAKTREKST